MPRAGKIQPPDDRRPAVKEIRRFSLRETSKILKRMPDLTVQDWTK